LVSKSFGGPDLSDYGKSSIMNELDRLLGKSNKSEYDLAFGADVIDACWGVIAIIPEAAVYAVMKNGWDLALSVIMTLVAFINLAIQNTLISILTLTISILCIVKLSTQASLIKDDSIWLLGLVSGAVGISTSCVPLGIAAYD
jgi:hypothetical protein